MGPHLSNCIMSRAQWVACVCIEANHLGEISFSHYLLVTMALSVPGFAINHGTIDFGSVVITVPWGVAIVKLVFSFSWCSRERQTVLSSWMNQLALRKTKQNHKVGCLEVSHIQYQVLVDANQNSKISYPHFCFRWTNLIHCRHRWVILVYIELDVY